MSTRLSIMIMGILILPLLSFSQEWTKNLPLHDKKDITFYDYQDAFYRYWSQYEIKDGYYYESGIRKKAAGWKQFKRWEYENEGRIDPVTGKFPQKTAEQVYEEYVNNNPDLIPSNSANWTSLGPNSSGGGYAGIGRLNCIAFHPTDNNTYWVGAASGGLWVTQNNGTSWTCLTDNNGVLAISDIIIPPDYITSNTIYIATGDKDHWDNRSIGVLKSTNGGSTWSATGLTFQLTDNKMVYKLLQDPSNNLVLLAATSGGVYKTTDGGTTWNTLLTTNAFIDMEYQPGNFSTLYGSTTGGKIYYSTNGGTSWTQCYNDASAARIELAVSQNQPTWVYALAAATDNGLYGVYKSTNSGASFTLTFSGLNLLGWADDGSDYGGQGWYDLSLAASPSNANYVFVGGVNTWRSTDGGISWNIVNHWSGSSVQAVHADKHMLRFRANDNLFECNDGGVYISTNNGTSWTDKTNTMVISQMYKIGVSQMVSNETITGLQDNGTKLQTGSTWGDKIGGDGMECLIDYADNNVQYGELYYGSIYRTTNHWSGSTSIKPSSSGDGAWVTPFIIDPTNNQILYAGYADVWKTTNRGTSWTKISTMNSSGKLRSMAIAPSNTQYLYVADNSVIWKTANGGTSWTNITGSLPVSSGNITAIAVKDNDYNTVWVTFSGYNTTRVYETTNGGTTWTNISSGLPNLPVYSIVQNKQSTSELHLYVGTELGVYIKKGTNSWVSFNTGLPNVRIGELDIYYSTTPQNSKVRAGTFGRGLWESPVEYQCTPTPVPTITGAATVCSGTTGVTYQTETGMTGYTWTVSSGGNITGGTGTSQITVTWSSAGSQTVTVNYFNSSGCSAAIPTVKNVTVNASPVPTISGSGTVCAGTPGNTYTTEPGMTGYSWGVSSGGNITGGTGTNQITVTWNTAGAQTVTVNYTSNGCTAAVPTVKNVTVNPLPVPVITPGGPTVFCAGNNVTLLCSPATSYLWNTGETTQSISVSTSGSYYVTVTNSSGCTGTSASTTVTVNPNPVANAGTDQIIGYGAATTLYGSASGGTGVYSWHWEPASLLVNANIQNPATVNMTSSSVFTLTVTDNPNSCTSTDDVMVTITGGPLSVDATADPDQICYGEQVQLMAMTTGGTGSNTWSWTSDPPGFVSNIQNPVDNPLTTTTYFVVASDGYATVNDSVEVSVLQIPAVPGTPSGPDNVDLNYITQSDFTISPVVSASSYVWNIAPAEAGTISGTSVTGTVSWNNSFTGNAYIKVKSANICGESGWSSEKLTIVQNSATGVSTMNGQSGIIIYPNPASDKIFIKSDVNSKMKIEIFDIQGKKIVNSVAEPSGAIDISFLSAGIYSVRIIFEDNKTAVLKLVKM